MKLNCLGLLVIIGLMSPTVFAEGSEITDEIGGTSNSKPTGSSDSSYDRRQEHKKKKEDRDSDRYHEIVKGTDGKDSRSQGTDGTEPKREDRY